MAHMNVNRTHQQILIIAYKPHHHPKHHLLAKIFCAHKMESVRGKARKL